MLIMDNLKLKDLKKYYNTEIEAVKQAIINELNRNCNMYNTRRFLYIEEIEEIDNYYKIQVIYKDDFITGSIKDTGIYYIHKEVL